MVLSLTGRIWDEPYRAVRIYNYEVCIWDDRVDRVDNRVVIAI